MRVLSLASLVAGAAAARIDTQLRTDGVPVVLQETAELQAEFALHSRNAVPFEPFSDEFVQYALAKGVDWREKGAVTPAKDQGAHGYCGTFGRTCAFEGQYAIRSGHGLRNFSEEELVECIGWTKDQFGYVAGTATTPAHGFEDMNVYPPYVESGYKDTNPPIPGHPCKWDKSKVIKGTDTGFTNVTSPAHNDEEQLAAYIFANGPVNSGVDASVFGLREKGCEAKGDCFITTDMCKKSTKGIDHSITLVGFGTDDTNGDYWIIKNSWSTKFGNEGARLPSAFPAAPCLPCPLVCAARPLCALSASSHFREPFPAAGFIKMARGYKDEAHETGGCAHIGCCGWVPCYGDCPPTGPDVKIPAQQ